MNGNGVSINRLGAAAEVNPEGWAQIVSCRDLDIFVPRGKTLTALPEPV